MKNFNINVLGTTALLMTTTFGQEFKINSGWDFYRGFKNSSTHSGFTQANGFPDIYDYRMKNGLVLGGEWLWDNKGEGEFGIGIEHKFMTKNKDTGAKVASLTPIYLTGKYNIINENGQDKLYGLLRLGYVYANEAKDFEKDIYGGNTSLSGGLYWGAGLGTEIGPVSLEALYERNNLKYQAHGPINLRRGKEKIDTFGVRVGYRFGDLENNAYKPSKENTKSGEVRINTGYDLSRTYKVASDHLGILKTQSLISDYQMKKGPTLGVEYLFDNQGEVEFGVGVEHKFSNNSSSLKDKKNNRMFKMTPIYTTAKYNIINKDGNDLLYGVARLGYNHIKAGKDNTAKITGGLYTAAGIGTEYGPVSAELLYERTDFRSAVDKPKADSVGIRIGYRLGQTKNYKGATFQLSSNSKNEKIYSSKSKYKNKSNNRQRTRSEIISGIDFVDVTKNFRNDDEISNKEKSSKKSKVVEDADIIDISSNLQQKNENKITKNQEKLDKKSMKDKLKEMKKKEAAIKKRLKMMDKNAKINNFDKENYSQNKNTNDSEKLVSSNNTKNKTNNQNIMSNPDLLNVVNFNN